MTTRSRTWTRITINGKTYNSVDEMPPDVRAQFDKLQGMLADNNHNGIPDIAEDGKTHATFVKQITTSTSTNLGLGSGAATPGPAPVGGISLSGDPGGGVRLSWPTLVALLASVAVIAAALVWWAMRAG